MPHKEQRMVHPHQRFRRVRLIHNRPRRFPLFVCFLPRSLYPTPSTKSGFLQNYFYTLINNLCSHVFSSVGTMGRETGIFLVCRFVFCVIVCSLVGGVSLSQFVKQSPAQGGVDVGQYAAKCTSFIQSSIRPYRLSIRAPPSATSKGDSTQSIETSHRHPNLIICT